MLLQQIGNSSHYRYRTNQIYVLAALKSAERDLMPGVHKIRDLAQVRALRLFS